MRGGFAVLLAAGLGVAACGQNDLLAQAYLRQAQTAIAEHRQTAAIAAIDRAESVWLGRNTVRGYSVVPVEPEVLREMARAKESVQMQNWDDASYYIASALTHPSILTPGLD
jgi:hypothetical protein